MDMVQLDARLNGPAGVDVRIKGFFISRWVLAYLTWIVPRLERLPVVLRIPDEVVERRVKWALERIWVEANSGDGRWVPIATGWDHIRQAV